MYTVLYVALVQRGKLVELGETMFGFSGKSITVLFVKTDVLPDPKCSKFLVKLFRFLD